MNDYEKLLKAIPLVEKKIGHTFKNPNLLAMSFVHRSFINENRGVYHHNERLEFLGDAILGFLIAEFLYHMLPETPEGELSFLRSKLVEASSCILFIQKLDVEEYILLGKGEKLSQGRGRESILSDLFEAIMGAIYLDGGLEAARTFLFGNFLDLIQIVLKTPSKNWKAQLQDYCQKKFQKTPQYKVIEESGPDHSKHFIVAVTIDEEIVGIGKGKSKKEAQQSSAEEALIKFSANEGQKS